MSCDPDVSALSGTCSLDRKGQGSPLSYSPYGRCLLKPEFKFWVVSSLGFFQPIDTAANPVKRARKETRDDVQKQKPSPVSLATSKDRDQVEA